MAFTGADYCRKNGCCSSNRKEENNGKEGVKRRGSILENDR